MSNFFFFGIRHWYQYRNTEKFFGIGINTEIPKKFDIGKDRYRIPNTEKNTDYPALEFTLFNGIFKVNVESCIYACIEE